MKRREGNVLAAGGRNWRRWKGDSFNADDVVCGLGCKDAKGDASVGRLEKGSPKLFGQGTRLDWGTTKGRLTHIRPNSPSRFAAETPPNTDKMKLVRRTSRPSPLPPSSSFAAAFFLLSCICIQTVCSLPFSSHRTHVENRLGELSWVVTLERQRVLKGARDY